MSKENQHGFEEEIVNSRFAASGKNPYGEVNNEFHGFSSKKEMMLDSLQRYWVNCKLMMGSSLSHLKSPITIISIIILVVTYILLGIAGKLEFSFYLSNSEQYITVSLDVIVNAFLGYFFGPITSAIGVGICCIVRIIASRSVFFIGYVIGATVAGFLHGWILYRHKTMWFGTRFRGFFTDLLAKSFVTRFVVSVFVNIILMAAIYKIFIDYPIFEFLMHYAKSGVELTSTYEFLAVFIVSLFVEVLIVFVSLALINFIIAKAFPSQFGEPSLIIDKDGTLINPEEEMDDFMGVR